jgi:hypothetical protein
MTAERGTRSRRRVLALASLLVAVLVAVIFVMRIAADGSAESSTSTDGDDPSAAHAAAEAKSTTGPSDAGRGTRAPTRRGRDVAARTDADGRVIGGRRDAATSTADAADATARERDGAGRSDAAGAAGAKTRSARGGGVARGSKVGDDPPTILSVRVKAAESESFLADADVGVFADDGASRRCRADYLGRATFSVPPGESMRVEAKSPGRVRKRMIVTTKRDAETAVVLSLDRGVVVQGRVVDAKGAVGAATVAAYALDAWLKSVPYDADPTPIETTTTDRKGAYRLDCIPRGTACALVVESDGHASAVDAISPQPDPDDVVRDDVRLKRALAVEGVVLDAAGKPVADAWVYAFDGAATFDAYAAVDTLSADDKLELGLLARLVEARMYASARPPRAASDADGRFRVLVPDDLKKVRMFAMHRTAGRSGVSRPFVPGTGLVELALRGRVRADFDVRTSTGKPSRGASIVPALPWETWSVAEGAPGIYGFAEMDDGPSLMDVTGVNDAPGTYVGRRIDVDRLTWLVKLRAGVAWGGVVRDDRGAPVPDAVVTAGDRSTTTDAFGLFHVDGVEPSLTAVDVKATGYSDTTYAAQTADRRTRADIVMRRAATLRLRLTLPAGAPTPTWRRVWRGRGASADGAPVDELSWKDGVFEFADWNAVDDGLALYAPGYAEFVLDVAAKPGATLDLGAVALVPARRFRASVVDDEGHPVSGAQLLLEVVGDEWWTSIVPARVVDADVRGGIEIALAAPTQKIHVVASAPGYASTPQTIDPSSASFTQPARIVIGRDRMFRGRATGLGRADCVAVLLGEQRDVYARATVDVNGRFEAEVPRTPHWIDIQPTDGGAVLRESLVPADFADGTVFEFAK